MSFRFQNNGDRLELIGPSAFLNGLSEITVISFIRADPSMIGTDRGWLTSIDPDGTDNCITQRFDNAGFLGGADDCIKLGVSTDTGESNLETLDNTQVTGFFSVAHRWQSGQVVEPYVNGELAGVTADSGIVGNLTANSTTFELGRAGKDTSASLSWSGDVFYARVYDRYLSPEEISTIYYCGGSDGIFDGLILYWQAFGPVGATIPNVQVIKDLTKTKADGQPVNNPTWGATPVKRRRQ